ncbi:HAMP domain-containing sensor histidine kinase [Petroclostridium sp. X23]|uniref:HAMP domain-containing sensor histidine kinase n=1 Tax=Petroclostridium sp. X23 TaxID=3045146 RepID=UPI0024AD713C|nr:HAMP domain-containing sensor histidine kinase [Petroclostridium sp. X23]WHH58643.1 HAMP domain-containing sensor histidine kinase [Petroclostridium sp. X23]
MDIKSKNYSHSVIVKIIMFMIVITCFTGAITTFVYLLENEQGTLDIAFEDSYYLGNEYMRTNQDIINNLTRIIKEFKNEEYILQGGTVTEDEIKREEEELFSQHQHDFNNEEMDLNDKDNYKKAYADFKEAYGEEISQIKERLIKQDLKEYNRCLKRLQTYKGMIFYASDGKNQITTSSDISKKYFKTFPSYMVFDADEKEVYPQEVKDSKYYDWTLSYAIDELEQQDLDIYIAFSDEFVNSKINKWVAAKVMMTDGLNRIALFLLGLLISFLYLVFTIGRKSFKDKEVHLNWVDKLYNDINVVLCFGLIVLWVVFMEDVYFRSTDRFLIPVTAFIASLGLILVLSLIKHIKNKTIIKHTLLYSLLYRIFKFGKDVYGNGNVGIKIIVIIIGYPLLVAATFFMFPVTIGVGAWLALKRVKEFNAIKEGVEKIKNGDVHHIVDVPGNGEFGKLAAEINGIAEGLNKAVYNEIKSERLKTELITNVSHDIRTPLTSIITYIDLLKKEKDPLKSAEYIEIIDRKAERLKILTDDLFEAAKASSGSIPVNYEKIDIVSLITQGLGELDDKIKASQLQFKINHPKDKMFISADGRLLWRAIENLLSNIFKYALKGSRIYIDIEDLENEIMITIKNISAYELNVSADELMERFKRGDESRSSQGSGLGLSIAKSLIDLQKGRFHIEIDGDLFKAVIRMPNNIKGNE